MSNPPTGSPSLLYLAHSTTVCQASLPLDIPVGGGGDTVAFVIADWMVGGRMHFCVFMHEQSLCICLCMQISACRCHCACIILHVCLCCNNAACMYVFMHVLCVFIHVEYCLTICARVYVCCLYVTYTMLNTCCMCVCIQTHYCGFLHLFSFNLLSKLHVFFLSVCI